MSLSYTKIFIVTAFLLLAAKWYVTGHFGRIAGHLVFVLPLCAFIYLSAVAILFKGRPAPKGVSGRLGERRLSWSRLSRAGKVQAVLLVAYLIIFSLALVRSAGISDYYSVFMMTGRLITVIILAASSYLLFRTYACHGRLDSFWTIIVAALGAYICLNIFGALAGIENKFVEIQDWTKEDIVLSLWDRRVSFPFSANHHAFAVEAGLFGSMLVAMVLTPGFRYRLTAAFVLVLTVLAMVAANTRTPLMGLVAVAGLAIAWRWTWRGITVSLLAVVVALPLLLVYVDITPLLSDMPMDLAFLARRDELSELATLNSRSMIWGHLFDEFWRIEPIHLVGFGAFGHVVSGLSYEYGRMWQDPELIMMHNTFLQYLIDFGYIGLFVFVVMLFNAIMVFDRYKVSVGTRKLWTMHPALAALLFLMIVGLMEVNIYYTQILTLFVFLFINYYVICFNLRPEVGPSVQPG